MKNPFIYSNSNKRYHSLDYFYKHKFGRKVCKISLNGGFTCPNKDGTKSTGGCIYCSKSGSGDFAGSVNKDIVGQFQEIKELMDKKWKDTLYIGYFQANTNTYASVDVLKQKYEPILKQDNVIGLSIATRPDAISEECIEYLKDLNQRTYLTIELGLQTIHEKTSRLINRGHDLACFEQMVKRLRQENLNVVVHIINGLPGENKEMMLETVKYLNKLDIQGIKIHMLHIIKNTALASLYEKEKFHLLTKEEYVDIVCSQLELLRPEIVIHRLTGDPDRKELVAPDWVLKKVCVLNDIDKCLAKRRTYQGFQKSILNRVHERFDYYVKSNSLVIDATVGNGNDTILLAQLANKGIVYGFDIQKQAIEATKQKLQENNITNVILYQQNHNQMKNTLIEKQGKISLITFNLGYLPTGDKTITTTTSTTIQAIEEGLELLHPNGILLITVYPGHEEGEKESIALQKYFKNQKVTYYRNDDNPKAPYLMEIKKKEYQFYSTLFLKTPIYF